MRRLLAVLSRLVGGSVGAACSALLAVLCLGAAPAAAQQPTQNPHGDVQLDCASCHTASGWKPLRDPLRFDHDDTGFELRDGHRGLACADCHEALDFAPPETGPRACDACHRADFDATIDPDHRQAGFPVTCSSCHSLRGWQPAREFDHAATGFLLDGGHRGVECISCHQTTFAGTPASCFSCHEPDYSGAVDPNHVQAGFETTCESCHTTQAWQPAAFDHGRTAFPLTGGHRNVDCSSCHQEGYSGTPTECYACHDADFGATVDPNHVQAGFETTCESCHTTQAWEPATFDHNLTAFALTGGHRGVDCVACHQDGYSGTPVDCYSCHEADFAGVADPDHVAAGFDTSCESCHTTQAWQPATFDHSSTAFQLTGGHQGLECAACHADGYDDTPAECYACHEADFGATVDPNHVQAGFELACESCHTTQAWEPATFEHDLTGFTLDGGHQGLDCVSCHQDGYEGTPSECFACHEPDFAATVDPNHVAAGFPTDCESCHTTQAWQPATFDHDLTAFALTGGHRDVDCISCHQDGYSGTPSECFACHEPDYLGTTDPNHAQAGFEVTCESCHTTQAWQPATFDHDASSSFPLTGEHRSVDCVACHQDGYDGTPTECFACHDDDYAAAADPEHASAGFPTSCESCHTTGGWTPADFEHDATMFPLTGAHRQTDCIACHDSGYTGTPTECFACHEADYSSAADPEHASAGFPTSCESCHTTVAWAPADFDHAATSFPLTGRHQQVDCVSCHQEGYAGTPSDCFSCHQAEWNQTTDPVHADAGFPTSCESCHTTSAWQPATFDHAATAFPLRGEHRFVDCAECHADGYSGTPTDCYSCHLTDYQTADDPDHRDAGFPTSCESCHDESDWNDANWDHDALYFPIDSGEHRGEWNQCQDCHVTPSNYRHFECILCHEHRQSEMDDEHEDVGGYRFESRSCLSCHPDGEE
ncbi:MAG: hypothetical protein DWQ36_25370 [Acidobacteria bacterium]|nr:MAG: hypothetical protein DWQ36_25370 [Acidobacteriota bacterium]